MDKVLVGLVAAFVDNKPLWALVGAAARAQILGRSEKLGLFVAEYKEAMEKANVYKLFDEVVDPSVQYPAYYQAQIHAYQEGNLNWTAAFESKYSWTAVAVAEKDDVRGPEMWQEEAARCITTYARNQGIALPTHIYDVGCSTGYSTRSLRSYFPEAQVTGVDASPYFLAVALAEDRIAGTDAETSRYVHAVFENSKLPANSADLVLFSFMFHECPAEAIEANLKKAREVVRPGGVVAMLDIDPYSSKYSKRPAAIKALRWASEPWLDAYERVDFPALMKSIGLTNVERIQMSECHHGYFARV